MDLPTGLASHLRALVESIGAGDDSITGSLDALLVELRTAVSSYQGMRLTLVLDGWPVTLTAFADIDGTRPATSLRLVLSGLSQGFSPESRVVFYAGSPGAFVDLAADLSYLDREREPTRTAYAPDGERVGHRPAVELDVDLPPVSIVSGLAGMTEYTTINRAVGVLIDRGDPPDHAQATLRRGAAASGLALPLYAARLLEE